MIIVCAISYPRIFKVKTIQQWRVLALHGEFLDAMEMSGALAVGDPQ